MMDRILSSKAALILLTLSFLLIPSITNAVVVTYLQPGYTSSPFLDLNFDTRSMAFDDIGNLYTSDIANEVPPNNNIHIQKLDASTNYTTRSDFVTYTSTGNGVTGLVFGTGGRLNASEYINLGNSGRMTKIDPQTRLVVDTIDIPNARPTGIEVVNGIVYFNGRLQSDPNFGNIYTTDFDSNTISFLFGPFVGKGIAMDGLGNLYSSTPGFTQQYGSTIYLANSIYKFAAGTLTPSLFATFDTSSGELTFDKAGNLYALFEGNDATTIIRISAAPTSVPALSLWGYLAAAIGLVGCAAQRYRTSSS
jgi:hypothetical protein